MGGAAAHRRRKPISESLRSYVLAQTCCLAADPRVEGQHTFLSLSTTSVGRTLKSRSSPLPTQQAPRDEILPQGESSLLIYSTTPRCINNT